MRKRFVLDGFRAPKKRHLTVPVGGHLTYAFFVGNGAGLDRTITIRLLRGSALKVYGIVLGSGSQQENIKLTVTHAEADAQSFISIKAVMAGNAYALIDGAIRIAPRAHGTDTRLEERALLLSPTARADTKPHLEIETHDVKASHAATVGRPSQDELFYLQTRGLAPGTALRLLVQGFLASQLAPLPLGGFHAKLKAAISRKIDRMFV